MRFVFTKIYSAVYPTRHNTVRASLVSSGPVNYNCDFKCKVGIQCTLYDDGMGDANKLNKTNGIGFMHRKAAAVYKIY